MRGVAPFGMVLATAVLAVGCGGNKRSVPADAAALVGDRTVSKASLTHALAHAQCGYARPSCPSRKQVLDLLVERAQLEQKANDLGIAPSDEDVERRLDSLKREYFGSSERRYRRQLVQQGLSERRVEGDLRAQLIEERLYEEITKGVSVDQADVKARYAASKSQYMRPASRLVRHVVVRQKATADLVYRKLRAGARFSAVVRLYSEDEKTRSRGGRFRHRRGDRGSLAFDRLVFSLDIGEIARPISIGDSWFVVQALGPAEGPRPISLRRAAPLIREVLLQERRQAAFAAWRESVKRELAAKTWYQAGFTQD